jgi:hypothetical protein
MEEGGHRLMRPTRALSSVMGMEAAVQAIARQGVPDFMGSPSAGLDPKLVSGPCAFGCDVRPGSWDLQIADLVRPAPDELLMPRLVFAGKLRDEYEVVFLLQQYKVRLGICDSRPEATLAARLQNACRALGVDVWRAQYATTPQNKAICGVNAAERIITLERSMTLDGVHHRLRMNQLGLPANFRQAAGGAFVAEMTSSTRIYRRWHGTDHYHWEPNGADHQFHAMNYLMVAIEFGHLDRMSTQAVGAELGYVSRPGDEDGDQEELEPIRLKC